MRGVVVVCGAHPGWGVPTLWGDVAGTPALGAVQTDGDDGDHEPRRDRFAIDGATHVTVVTRPEWAEQVRSAATVLRAHDPDRHVAVVETRHVPLASTVLARAANERLDHDPAQQHAAVTAALASGDSGLWVRSAGRLPRRVPLPLVVSSWWRRAGNLDTVLAGPGPARAEDWARVAEDGRSVLVAGPVPEAVREQVEAAEVTLEPVGDEVSPGAEDLAGQGTAFELALVDDRTVTPGSLEGPGCSSCGITVQGPCPFCHASWGSTENDRGRGAQ